MHRMIRLLTPVLGALILAGCSVTAPYQRPAAVVAPAWDQRATELQTGAQSDAQSDTATAVAPDWWRRFGNAELDRLMEQALAANHDLGAAIARIERARAALGVADADRYPAVNLSGGANRSHSDRGGDSESSQLALNVAYEIDLWGARRASIDAAGAGLESSIYDRDALALVLQSEVAANYFQILSLKDRLAIAHRNLDAARQVMRLVQTRYELGANTGLEVAQQRTSVLNQEAQIPQLEQSLAASQTALALLLGELPQDFRVEGASLEGLLVPEVAAYQPPELLERRPDIRSMEAQLIAARANIAIARAALYPRVSLSASAAASGIITSGSSLVASLAASLAQTIFDGGRLQGQEQQAQAREMELIRQYLQSVLTGQKEVQDSLVAVSASRSRQLLLDQAVLQAQEAYRIASVRFEAGAQDLLTLLDSQRTQLQAEDSRIQAALARLTATVTLYKALGGGWRSEDAGRS